MSDKYCGDVWYEVWRGGGNPDAVSRDDCEDCREAGDCPEEAAAEIVLRQNRKAAPNDGQ